MKASLGTLPDGRDGWAFEIKWDGYRTLAFVDGGRVRLQSSNLYDVTHKYPELAPLADGVARQRSRPRRRAGRARRPGPAALRADPAPRARRPRCSCSTCWRSTATTRSTCRTRSGAGCSASCSSAGDNWTVPAHRIGDGAELLDATGAQELEGVMAKRLGTIVPAGHADQGLAQGQAPPPGRGRDRRLHARHRQPVVELRGAARRSVGRRRAGRSPAASGTGFTQRRLDELTARLRGLRTAECPFDPPPPTAYRRGAMWVEPVLTATVEITEFTNEGYVRHASFIGPRRRFS